MEQLRLVDWERGQLLDGVTMTLGSDASYDIYYRGSGGVLTRLANGTSGQYLGANTGAAPSWQTPAGGSQTPWTGNINAAGYTLFGNNTAGGALNLASTSGTGSNDVVNIKGGTAGGTTIASFFGAGTYAGRVGIGTTTPSQLFSVGSTSQFTVDSSGNLNSQTLSIGAGLTSVVVSGTGTGSDGSPNGTYYFRGVENGANYYQLGSSSWYITYNGSGTWGICIYLNSSTCSTYGKYFSQSGTVPTPPNNSSWSDTVYTGSITTAAGTSSNLTVDNAGDITSYGTLTAVSLATTSGQPFELPTSNATAGCLKTSATGQMSVATCGDVDNQSFNANGTYSMPSGALMIVVETWGGGGGGGGGAGGNNLNSAHAGGGGGGGASYVNSIFSATTLGTPGTTTLQAIVGGGGAGGGGGNNVNGTAGNSGGSSCLSTTNCTSGTIYVEGWGGGGGAQGAISNTQGAGGGGGGGAEAVGGNASTTTGGTGGAPQGSTAGTANSGYGGAGGATSTNAAVNGASAQYGGAGGGASTTTGANASGNGGGSVIGGSGGGGGGSVAVTTYAKENGGAGGTGQAIAGGGGTAGTTNGAGGSNGNPGVGGGGDGGGGGATNSTGTGGTGGTGGARGGGGGGGGATGTGGHGGTGGTGGAGFVRVWSYMGQGADLAEIYGTMDPTLSPGDIVAVDSAMQAGVKKSSVAYDSTVIGVVSTNPGIVIGNVSDPGATPVMVALAGRVPMKVNMENGPIKSGDYLTASSTPGEAMKATKAGLVIGEAITPYNTTDMPGIVMAFIKAGPSNGSKLTDLIPGLTTDDGTTTDSSTTNSNSTTSISPPTTTDTIGTSSTTTATTPSAPTQTIEQQALAYFNTGRAVLATQVDLSEVTTDRVSAGLEVITPDLYATNVHTDTIQSATGDNIGLILDDSGEFTIGKQTISTVVNPDGTTTPTTIYTPEITMDNLGNAVFSGGLTIGTPQQPNGITMYDTTTGSPYCSRITNGTMVTSPGKCSDILGLPIQNTASVINSTNPNSGNNNSSNNTNNTTTTSTDNTTAPADTSDTSDTSTSTDNPSSTDTTTTPATTPNQSSQSSDGTGQASDTPASTPAATPGTSTTTPAVTSPPATTDTTTTPSPTADTSTAPASPPSTDTTATPGS